MEWIELGKLIEFQKKSKIKAGDGKTEGKYLMYTSSMLVDKYLDEYQYSEEALIMGTGGNASIHYSSGKFGTSTDCYVIYNKGAKALLKYIYYYLLGNIYILEEGFRGAGLKHTNQKYIKNIKIPILSVEAQEKIVKVLDQAQALIDKRKEQIEALDQLIESIFYTMFGDPVRNEKGWDVDNLSNVCEMRSGGTPSRKNPEYFMGNIPWITTVALDKIYLAEEDAIEYITEEAVKKSATKIIPRGALMIGTRVGVGKVSICNVDMCTNQDIVSLIGLEKHLNRIFIYKQLKNYSPYLQSKMRGATIKGINMRVLKELRITIPPISLQNEFAQKVEAIEKQKDLLEESLELLEENYQSIMDKAFKGQLFN